MKRGKSDTKLDKYDAVFKLTRQRSVQILIGVGLLYLLLVTLEIPFVFYTTSGDGNDRDRHAVSSTRPPVLESEVDLHNKNAPSRPLHWVSHNFAGEESGAGSPRSSRREVRVLSSLAFDPITLDPSERDRSVELHKAAKGAWEVGRKVWRDLEMSKGEDYVPERAENWSGSCPHSVLITGSEFLNRGKVVELPCGLTLGSHVTVVGKPRGAHAEKEPKIALVNEGGESVMVSQFMMELQGLKAGDGEDPPRILHFNPRLRGDWSGKPVIEQNTCYRMQWGSALRCEGWKSKADEETGE